VSEILNITTTHKLAKQQMFRRSIGLYFLRTFTKLRKATIGIVMSVCPSVCPHGQTTSYWADFHEILYLSIFRKSANKIKFSLKSNKNNEYFT